MLPTFILNICYYVYVTFDMTFIDKLTIILYERATKFKEFTKLALNLLNGL